MSRQANKMTVDLGNSRDLVAMLERLPKMVVASGGPTDRAVRKAITVVAVRARQVALNSSKTGTKEKMSRKSRAKWPVQVKNTIRTKTIKYPTSSYAIVGPKSPEGNAAHFMQEKPRKHVLWGKRTAAKALRIARNWITRAFDETKAKQQSAMVASLKQDIDQIMRSV